MNDDNNETAITLFAVFIGAFVGFAIAYWLWPWLGPQMFNPCPQWTGLGVGLYTGWHALKSVGSRMKTVELERLKRRITQLEEQNPIAAIRELRKAVGR